MNYFEHHVFQMMSTFGSKQLKPRVRISFITGPFYSRLVVGKIIHVFDCKKKGVNFCFGDFSLKFGQYQV